MADYPFYSYNIRGQLPSSTAGLQPQPYPIDQRDDIASLRENQMESMSAFMQNKRMNGPSLPIPGQTNHFMTQTWNQQQDHSGDGIFSRVGSTISGHNNDYTDGNHNPNITVPFPRLANGTAGGVEEGELSEGEFEDSDDEYTPTLQPVIDADQYRYEGNHNDRQIEHRQDKLPGLSRRVPVRESDIRAASPAVDIYGRSREDRRQSDSYSPQLSPVECNPHVSPVEPQTNPHDDTTSQFSSTRHQGNYSSAEPYHGKDLETDSGPREDTDTILSSLSSARKDAQSAILNLWPFKIRLEHYVGEGIDEEIVRKQFKELGMLESLKPLDKPENSTLASTADIQKHSSSENPSHRTTKNSEIQAHNPAEERKDRIARLLAEKIQKKNNQSMAPDNPAKADKERLLRQKMEALQKSREARAQKATTKTPAPGHMPKEPILSTVNVPNSVILQSRTEVENDTRTSQTISPPPQTTSQPQLSTMASIPGLHLAGVSKNNSTVTSTEAPASNTVGLPRKRPVASDFDAMSTSEQPYKRPFGQNRIEERLVIDVSEDESEDDAADNMDLDESSSNGYGELQIRNSTSGGLRDHPPLSDFPQRKTQTPIANLSTPSTPQPTIKIVVGKPEDLQQKQLAIQELKRKIALAELRNKARRPKKAIDPPHSEKLSEPLVVNSASNTPETVGHELAAQVETSLETANAQINHERERLAQAQTLEAEKIAQLHKMEIDRRRLRQAKIVADLPEFDAEIQDGQKRLEELKLETAKYEALVQQKLEERRKLAEEMQKLNDEADEQIQEQKEKLHALNVTRAADNQAAASKSQQSMPERGPVFSRASPSTVMTQTPTLSEPQDLEMTGSDAEVPPSHDLVIEQEPGNIGRTPRSQLLEPLRTSDIALDISDNSTAPEIDRSLDAALQSAIATAEAESHDMVSSDIDMENIYAPNPSELAPESPESQLDRGPHDESPNLTSSPKQTQDSTSIMPPPISQSGMIAEATDGVLLLASPPFSPVPPNASTGGYAHELNVEPGEMQSISDRQTMGAITHRSPSASVQTQRVDASMAPVLDAPDHFTPYESPLKLFRSFRFHPFFEQQVNGGFKSLTFSNNIDVDKVLCPTETAGEPCDDSNCDFQHFRTMGLADDAILVELGNSAPYSDADKPRFVTGLRNLLQQLRVQKTKDFKIIASEIAAFRPRFLNDKSRVLVLDVAV